ncbi:hypothetical protein [Roseitalea porphyridii]|uniref:Uncharacterized protein n=1 Tax=Roseitalea porphyridii TaxID=1852022 RepID=A0A4P6V1W1_9HYPH|nr:hypothetical protein [Roseitalea porphyridii]QBK31351.1 hypothetical protein E0E05_12505 [Roseitalea porphyridii]
MQIRPIQAVTCVLLHDRYDPVDGLQLLDFIGLAAARAGLSARAVTGPESTEKDLDVRFGAVRVTVRQAAQPVSPKSLAAALDYPVTHLMMPEARAIAGRHVASTLISAERLDTAETEAAQGDATEPPAFEDWRQARSAMMVCLLVADYVAGKNRASAVHWRPSDHLVSQSVLREAAQGEAPQAPYGLFVRPHLLRNAEDDKNAARGIAVAGAEHLVGVPVSVAPEDVPYGWMADRAVDFVFACHQRGGIVPDGETVGAADAELVRVDHLPPTDEAPAGQIRLVAVRSERHGIGEAVAEMRSGPAGQALAGRPAAELDPDDEIDQAILTLLAERSGRDGTQDKAAGTPPVPDTGAAAPTAAPDPLPVVARAPATPVPFRAAEPEDLQTAPARRQALALSELRRIANGGTMPSPRERSQPTSTPAAEPPRFVRTGVERTVPADDDAGNDRPAAPDASASDSAPNAAAATLPEAEPVAFELPDIAEPPATVVPDAEPVAFDLLADPDRQAGLLRGILARLRRRTIRSAA